MEVDGENNLPRSEDDDVESDASDSEQQDEDDEALPLVRHHSYLPGALHPLYTGLEQDAGKGAIQRRPSFASQNSDRPLWMQELAVLELTDVILFPGATLPIRLTDSEWIQHLRQQIDSSESSESAVRFGVLCKTTQAPSPRRSWARRGYGPSRLRRPSERLLAELGQDFDLDDDMMEPIITDRRQVADQLPVQLGEIALTEEQPAEGAGTRASLPSAQQQPNRHSVSRAEEESRQREERQRKRSSSYIGRIGAIATVLYTHGDDEQRSPVRGGVAQSLVVTAIGSARFRIMGFRSREEEQDYSNNLRRPGGVRRFLVEELEDTPLTLPPLDHIMRLSLGAGKYYEQVLRSLSIVSPVPIHALRMVWPWRLVAVIQESMKTTPALAGLELVLQPMVRSAVTVEGDSSALPPLEVSARHDDSDQCLLEPVAFSFWMAANLPLQQEEKLQLLEMNSTIERLRFICSKIVDETAEAVIHCRNCLTPISRARQMFTVGGAEGTTGNYVNEHGIVHQTITLRQIDEDEIWYQGDPVAQDSWFPGYSWTIMVCGVCGHHLGWQFRRVPGARSRSACLPSSRASTTSTENMNRPEKFFGVSAANVATFIPTARGG
jgi:ATP-dependent protease La (LON) substrate-binding domain/Yippee zinc-binding/DNA-binding /Mis18, centromere assembly